MYFFGGDICLTYQFLEDPKLNQERSCEVLKKIIILSDLTPDVRSYPVLRYLGRYWIRTGSRFWRIHGHASEFVSGSSTRQAEMAPRKGKDEKNKWSYALSEGLETSPGVWMTYGGLCMLFRNTFVVNSPGWAWWNLTLRVISAALAPSILNKRSRRVRKIKNQTSHIRNVSDE